MKLGGKAIREALESGLWSVSRKGVNVPTHDLVINPNSVDVTLHATFLVPLLPAYDLNPCRDGDPLEWIPKHVSHNGAFALKPGGFVLGAVREAFDCTKPLWLPLLPAISRPDLGRPVPGFGPVSEAAPLVEFRFAPMFEGRSTVGRIGLDTHSSAGFGDYGFTGAFTLELFNKFPYPLLLTPGMRIGQVAFEPVIEPTLYAGAYSGPEHRDGPQPPKLGRDRFF